VSVELEREAGGSSSTGGTATSPIAPLTAASTHS
jgi:hypothetical protein